MMNTQGKPGTLVRRLAWLLLALPLVAGGQVAQQQQPAAAANPVDPAAVAALDRMGTALRALKTFSLRSDTSSEVVLETGQKLAFDGEVNYRVQRPNRIFVDMKTDRRHRQLFYDGDNLTVYSPRLKYYASVDDVGATLGELAVTAREEFGIEFPLADLFFWGTDQAPRNALKAAMYVGPGTLDGDPIEHYAYRQENVDWQLWMSKASALPHKIVITSLDDPAMPQYAARLHWNTKDTSEARSFTFVPPSGAARIELVPVALAVTGTPEGN